MGATPEGRGAARRRCPARAWGPGRNQRNEPSRNPHPIRSATEATITKRANKTDRRGILKAAGLFAAGAMSWPEAVFDGRAAADEKAPAANAAIGRREIIKGLDGMSRAADPKSDPFVTGHMAAAVMSSAFFCREQKIDGDAQKEIRARCSVRLLDQAASKPRN